MDLDKFVSKTMTQIFQGILDAQKKIRETGGEVNPRIHYHSHDHSRMRDENANYAVNEVQFDVGVTTIGTTGQEESIKVFEGSTDVISHKAKTENMAANRIKFSVPVLLPHGEKE